MVLSRSLANPSPKLMSALRGYSKLVLTGVERPQRVKPKRARRLSDVERLRLAQRYTSGATVYELADEFRMARETVSSQLKLAGVSMRRQTLSAAEIDEAIALYATGLSTIAIGERLKRDATGIWRVLKNHGVQMRDPHDRGRSVGR